MADKRISELPALASVDIVPATDVFPIVNGGVTKKVVLTDAVAAASVTALATKQNTLVSGTSIKTVNGTTLLGSGNISTASVPTIVRTARTSNTLLGVSDATTLIDITSGTFTQTFDAVATLGSGWYLYIRNSGTGDITLDPNGAETIDGLTSYIMYPGEVRLVQCDGAALRTLVLQSFYRAFTASGTFTKPPGYSYFGGLLWSAGSSGERNNSAVTASRGGGGGGCFPLNVLASAVGTTETVTIGAGGLSVTTVATGNAGGSTSFGSWLTVFGSPAGTPTSGGSIGAAAAISTTNTAIGFEATTTSPFYGIWAGGSSDAASVVNNSGSSLYGGGAGGGLNSSAALRTPGTSKFAGAGGAASSASNGTDGSAPAGGGGSTQTGTQSGAGARGELRIWGIV